jgi:hypothetical protein
MLEHTLERGTSEAHEGAWLDVALLVSAATLLLISLLSGWPACAPGDGVIKFEEFVALLPQGAAAVAARGAPMRDS